MIATSGYLLTGLWDGEPSNAEFIRYAVLGDSSSDASGNLKNTYMTSSYYFIDTKNDKITGDSVIIRDGADDEAKIASGSYETYRNKSTYGGWYKFDGINTFTRVSQ